MVLLFHDMLLRCNTCAYTQTYQKEQQLFNPRRAHRAPWVGSANRDSPPPLRDTLYITENSGMGACSKMGLLHPPARGSHHGAEPVILPTPRGCSHPHLPPHP